MIYMGKYQMSKYQIKIKFIQLELTGFQYTQLPPRTKIDFRK